MKDFKEHWSQVLQGSNNSVDLLASIREEAINDYLAKHFRHDNARYKVKKEFTAKVSHDGTTHDLAVTLTLHAQSKLVLNFKPLAGGGGGAVAGEWTDLEAPEPEPGLSTPNIQVRVDKVAFSVDWNSVYSPGTNYSWHPSPVLFEAEAYVRLETIDGPDEESRHVLMLTPQRVRFEGTERFIYDKELKKLIDKLPEADKLIVQKHAVDKFDELLLIALNTAANELAPRFVQAIEIPAPVVAKKQLVPADFQIEDNIATIGFGLDDDYISSTSMQLMNNAMAEVKGVIEQDIDDAGGFRKLVVADGQNINYERLEDIKRLELRTDEDMLAKLVNTTKLISRYEELSENDLNQQEQRLRALKEEVATVPDGVGIAINEYFLDSLASTFSRNIPKRCTRWLPLGVVRGRACYWTRIFAPDVKVGGDDTHLVVKGTVGVDAGGSLDGCVRKFWDCSWRWVCNDLRMAVAGRPGVRLTLIHHKYIAFTGEIVGSLALETNLPFPFNKIAKAVSLIVWEGVKAILNIFLRHIKIVIVPGLIEIPRQNTGLRLRDFEPFYFLEDRGSEPDSKDRFAAFSVGTVPTNV